MIKSRLAILFFLITTITFAQNFSDSNLPIILITTDNDPLTGYPLEIQDEPRVWANMKIIYRPDGSRNYLSDQNNAQYLNYNGKINIEIRGSSSQVVEKKSYGLTTYLADKVSKNNVEILGMPKENDWILYGIPFEKSLIRNHLSYDLVRSIGDYAARCRFCEVLINGNYRGIYVFMEKLKIDGDRIDIVKMTNLDNTDPGVTGGYVVKADKTTGGDPVAWTMSSYHGYTDYIFDNPGPWDITPQQSNYIRNQFGSLETAAYLFNSSITSGYPSVIDIPSFIDYMLMSELASNADSYQFSTYFHKDRGGKLRAGPVWDFDLTYGYDLDFWGFDRSKTNVWQFDNSDNTGSKFWRDLYNTPSFRCYLAKRWNELTSENGPLNYSIIENHIDQLAAQITEAIPRENARWGNNITHSYEISEMKNWIQDRMQWIDSKLSDYSGCANPEIPQLVISKINYHPISQSGYEEADLEFLEITNAGTQTVDLTGVYFSQLGISYQFPAGTSIGSGKSLYLAGDKNAVQQVYGISVFGQFIRDLSNKSEKIVLSDAFGNIIDSVTYTDDLPWPAEADGSGFFLRLTDIHTDNSLASSWVASTNITGIGNRETALELSIYPNPARSSVTIDSGNDQLVSCEVYDLSGRKLLIRDDIYSNTFTFDIQGFNPGMYLLKVNLENRQAVTMKITKI